jgi:hypothetical protein
VVEFINLQMDDRWELHCFCFFDLRSQTGKTSLCGGTISDMINSCFSPFDRASDLSVSCFEGNVEMVQAILAQMPQETLLDDRTCCFRLSPLHYAIWGGCFEAFRSLLLRDLKLVIDEKVRWDYASYASVFELCDGQLKWDDAAKVFEVNRMQERKRIREVLEKGTIRKPWDWSIRRLLLIRDGAFVVVPKDVCRLLVRSYCFDVIQIYAEEQVE